jgi:hypothetical protein
MKDSTADFGFARGPEIAPADFVFFTNAELRPFLGRSSSAIVAT